MYKIVRINTADYLVFFLQNRKNLEQDSPNIRGFADGDVTSGFIFNRNNVEVLGLLISFNVVNVSTHEL